MSETWEHPYPRALAEWIVDGGWQRIDLTALGWQRVIDGRPLREQAVV